MTSENYGRRFLQFLYGVRPLEQRLVTVYRKRKGQIFVFENVPARVCQNCGERFFVAEVAQTMERLIMAPEVQQRIISVPVIAFVA